MPNDATSSGATATPPPVPGPVQPPAADTTPAQPTLPQGQPIIINVNAPPAYTPPPAQVVNIPAPKASRLKKILVACVVAVGILAGIGMIHGSNPWTGNSNPVIIAPVPSPSPTAPAPLSHQPPEVQTSAYVGIHSVGNQSWVDVTVSLRNMGNKPVDQLAVSFQQAGVPLAITDGPWNAVPGGMQYPYTLGVGGSVPSQTFRIEQWTPGKPISVVVSGNGVLNSPSQTEVACPTVRTNVENVGCNLVGG